MIEDNQILFAITFPQVLFTIHIDGLVLDVFKQRCIFNFWGKESTHHIRDKPISDETPSDHVEGFDIRLEDGYVLKHRDKNSASMLCCLILSYSRTFIFKQKQSNNKTLHDNTEDYFIWITSIGILVTR